MQPIQKETKLLLSPVPKFEHQTLPKDFHMKSLFKPILLAGLLTTASLVAFSQTPAMGDHNMMMGAGSSMHEGMKHEHMGKMDPARMQARFAKRAAALKARLKLSAAQEDAWTTFTAAMKPSPDLMAKRPDFSEIAKLPTPERIDKMKALHSQHINDMTATMDKRGEAAKAFYAVLTPEQQKVFDASTVRQHGFAGHRGARPDNKTTTQPKQ
jgi:Spy/CpxP family protein refolding chaperone